MANDEGGANVPALEPDAGYVPHRLRAGVDIASPLKKKWLKEAGSLVRPTKNGYNDAMSHLFILDTLLRLQANQMIRASGLRQVLRREFPQIIWDNVTIGRILGELTDLAAETSTGKGMLTSARDRLGTYFTLSDDHATYKWLAELREIASGKVAEEMAWINQGLEPPARTFSVWDELHPALAVA